MCSALPRARHWARMLLALVVGRVQGFGACENLATVPGISRGEGEPSFCMNYSLAQWRVGRREAGQEGVQNLSLLFLTPLPRLCRDPGVPSHGGHLPTSAPLSSCSPPASLAFLAGRGTQCWGPFLFSGTQGLSPVAESSTDLPLCWPLGSFHPVLACFFGSLKRPSPPKDSVQNMLQSYS